MANAFRDSGDSPADQTTARDHGQIPDLGAWTTSFIERHLKAGAVRPSDDVRTELRGYLEADSSGVG